MAISRTSPDFWRTLFAFTVPSLIGVFLFMTPVPVGDVVTIPIAVMAKNVQQFVAPFIHPLIVAIVCITGLMSLAVSVFNVKPFRHVHIIQHLFKVSPIWLVTRLAGMVFILMTYFKVYPMLFTQTILGP